MHRVGKESDWSFFGWWWFCWAGLGNSNHHEKKYGNNLHVHFCRVWKFKNLFLVVLFFQDLDSYNYLQVSTRFYMGIIAKYVSSNPFYFASNPGLFCKTGFSKVPMFFRLIVLGWMCEKMLLDKPIPFLRNPLEFYILWKDFDVLTITFRLFNYTRLLIFILDWFNS